jgi:hypothetical protein
MPPTAFSLHRPRRPARRTPPLALLGVLALHALLLAGLMRLGLGRDREPVPASATQLLWLLDSTPATAARSPAAPVEPVEPVAQIRRAAPPLDTRRPEPAPGDLQAISVPVPVPVAVSPAAPTTDTASGAPAPLNLSLPRAASSAWRQRSPAVDDVRANTRTRANMATQIEAALGGDPEGPISEESLVDGSVRFRRGGQCVIARPNRAQNLDPFNSSFSPKARLLDKC